MPFTSESGGIILLGLGPGSAELLTRQAWQVLEGATEVYLRTRQHPAVAGLPAHLDLHSFDALYERGETFEAVHAEIVEQVLALARRSQGVTYAVPGHPLVAESTGVEILRRARAEGLRVRVVEGLSFLEPTATALGLDPFPQAALVDALELAALHVPPFPTSAPALVAQIHSRAIASGVRLSLSALYPDEHPVRLVHAAGTPDERVEDLALNAIDRSENFGPQTALWVPPLGAASSFEAFQEVVARLRAPDGCPWDREQTHQSLRADLLEEAYEVLAAIDAGDVAGMEEELGDLLLLILLNAQIATEAGEFNMSDVLRGIHTKIVRRHPHVFSDVQVNGTQDVLQNWERIKAQEKAEKRNGGQPNEEQEAASSTAAGPTPAAPESSVLDGVSRVLPALTQAEKYQKRAARVGFDWPTVEGVLAKIEEEIEEVKTAASPGERAAEIGDLLFAVTNLARWHHVDPESALREASLRFRTRFNHIEATARSQGKKMPDMSLDEMEALWQEAKHS